MYKNVKLKFMNIKPKLLDKVESITSLTMEQHAKNVNNYWNTNIYSYLETSVSQSSNLYLNVVHFFNACVNETSVAD